MRFSVIIPFGNAESTLRESLSSVRVAADKFAAVGGSCEIICSNGGSTDGSADIVREIAAIDPRVVALNARPPADLLGPGAARNRGMDAAKGDYFVFVDADDALHPDAFLRLAEAEADIITFLPPTGRFDLSQPSDRRRAFSPMVGNLLAWNAIYRRERIGTWRFPVFANYEDIVFTAGAFARARTLVSGFTPWYDHREQVSGSATSRHTWARVRAGWLTTPLLARAVAPCLSGLGMRLVLIRKLTMHLVIHCFAEVFAKNCHDTGKENAHE